MPRKFTQEHFISKSILIHNNKYDYSLVKYVNQKTHINIICNIHGQYKQSPEKHLLGRGCPTCGIIKCGDNQTSSTEEFSKKASLIHNNKYDYSLVDYEGSNKKIIIICPEHGQFKMLPGNHFAKNGCKKCAALIMIKKNTLPISKVIDIFNQLHNNKYDYSLVEYINQCTKIVIICKLHGTFKQTPNSHSQGSGCPKCIHRISKQEIIWLDSLGIPNDDLHRQVKLKIDNRTKWVDGFNPATNTVYEFYGDYWHGNPAIYNGNDINVEKKKSFGSLYLNTISRENSIKNAGYNIITIWENDLKQLNANPNYLFQEKI